MTTPSSSPPPLDMAALPPNPPSKPPPPENPSFGEIMNKAAASAVRGGTAGAVAMGANVAALMWLRTTVSCDRTTTVSATMQCANNLSHLLTTLLLVVSILVAAAAAAGELPVSQRRELPDGLADFVCRWRGASLLQGKLA
jgi:hypothetical protein